MSSLKTSFALQEKYSAFYTGGQIQLTSDGSKLFCRCGKEIKIVDIKSGRTSSSIGLEEDEEISQFIVTRDDEYLILATHTQLFRQWRWKDKVLVKTWRSVHNAPVTSLGFDSTVTLLASGSADSTVKVWDIIRGYFTHNFKGHSGVVRLTVFHPVAERLQLVTAAEDYTVKIWDLSTSLCLLSSQCHTSLVTSIAFADNGDTMYSAGKDNVVCVWKTDKWKVFKTIPIFEPVVAVIVPLEFPSLVDEDEIPRFVVVSSKGDVHVINARTGKKEYSNSCRLSDTSSDGAYNDSYITLALYSPDLNGIVFATYDQNIIVLSKDFTINKQLCGHLDEVMSIHFTGEKDSHIAMATNTDLLKVFNRETWECQLVQGHTDIITSIDVNGNFIVSGSKDSSIRLWHLSPDSGCITCLGTGQGHTQAVQAVAFASQVKSESGEDTPKLSKSVTIELTRIDAALSRAQSEEDASRAQMKPRPRKAASDTTSGWDCGSAGRRWIHLTTTEITGLKQLVDYLSGLMAQPPSRRGVPREMLDPEAVLREIRQVLEDHKDDDQSLSITGDPVIGWSESTKKKQHKLKLGYKTFKTATSKGSPSSSSTIRRRRTRCKQCEACTRTECGECTYCKDMRKFGGPGRMKQTCISRQCMAPILPSSSVCCMCNTEGHDNTDDPDNISMQLMECGICWEIVHPGCLQKKYENLDNEGVVNEDLPNSWECSKCCNDGKRGQLKPRVRPGVGSSKRVKNEDNRSSADSEDSPDDESISPVSPVEGKRVVSKEEAKGGLSALGGNRFIKVESGEIVGMAKWSPDSKRISKQSDVKVKSEAPGTLLPRDDSQRKRNNGGSLKDQRKAVKKEQSSVPNSPSPEEVARARKRPSGGGTSHPHGGSSGRDKLSGLLHGEPHGDPGSKRPKRETIVSLKDSWAEGEELTANDLSSFDSGSKISTITSVNTTPGAASSSISNPADSCNEGLSKALTETPTVISDVKTESMAKLSQRPVRVRVIIPRQPYSFSASHRTPSTPMSSPYSPSSPCSSTPIMSTTTQNGENIFKTPLAETESFGRRKVFIIRKYSPATSTTTSSSAPSSTATISGRAHESLKKLGSPLRFQHHGSNCAPSTMEDMEASAPYHYHPLLDDHCYSKLQLLAFDKKANVW